MINSASRLPFWLFRQIILTLSLACLISGCASTSALDNWPESLPNQSTFIDAFTLQQSAGTNRSTVNQHLVWIKRFYLGSAIYPLGWNRMTQILINSLAQDIDRTKLNSRMHDLGLKISIEWAQDNRFRKIDSAAVAVWGNALKTSADKNEQLEFIGKIEADVDALLAKELVAEDIGPERYYPVEDFDDF